jgi:thiol-disulfide isomerase/thioredoxin
LLASLGNVIHEPYDLRNLCENPAAYDSVFCAEYWLREVSMRCVTVLAVFLLAVPSLPFAQENTGDGPTNEKAQKTYNEALGYQNRRMKVDAFEAFKKADKQDGGHCSACQRKIIQYGMELGDWKVVETASEELLTGTQGNKDLAVAHYQFGIVLMTEGVEKHKDELFMRAHEEFTKALEAAPNFPMAVFGDGRALGHLKEDDKAKERFQQFVDMHPEDDPYRERALHYIAEPELARARMAPAFAVTTIDGQRISMDDLTGKVVLIDFWATWCGPCREALPHMREIAKKFQGQPLVVLSVSLDGDEGKWKEFIAKNEMTWPQYRDGAFTGPIAELFGVHAIPHTFTIDSDGILQDEHIGDSSIEGKLKKLIVRAEKAPPRKQETKTATGDEQINQP